MLVSTFSFLSDSPLSEGGGTTAACVLEQGFSSQTVLSGSANVDLRRKFPSNSPQLISSVLIGFKDNFNV